MARQTLNQVGSKVVIGAFLVSGTFHLIAPAQFMPLLLDWTPYPLALVYLSGIAELLAAIGLIARLRWAPIFTALVLLAVWPANWRVAIEATNNAEIATAVIAWLRLPLQLPLIYWALKSPVKRG
ncbi:MAG TPA: DoxX family protein [Candidatus Aquiluna sp.]|nr:DoxX family protein [Aquiluna sp.]